MASATYWWMSLVGILLLVSSVTESAGSEVVSATDVNLATTMRGHDEFPCEMINRPRMHCNFNQCRWVTVIIRGLRRNAGGHCGPDSRGRCRLRRDLRSHAIPSACHSCMCRNVVRHVGKALNPECNANALPGYLGCVDIDALHSAVSNAGKRKSARKTRRKRRS